MIIEYCRKRAIAKNVQLNAKRNYINNLNMYTPMSKIWNRIRKIRGKYKRSPAPYLIKDDNHITDKNQIADLMTRHYLKISSSESYDASFQRKIQTMERRIDFSTNEEYLYNSPIRELEL